MKVVSVKELEKLINLLRARAVDMAKKSEGNDSNKGFWQAGQAEGLAWAADHLETICGEGDESEPFGIKRPWG